MRSDKKILIAFLLNLFFAIFEFFGGIFTNSIAIISDAIHDIFDALSIGISFVLEKVSKRKPDSRYTYGYQRYSILGAFFTTVILVVGSIFVIINAIKRIINPVSINYDGMIIFAIIGIIVNLLAVIFTKDGDSLNQKVINLHMLEDVLGWLIVFIGAIIIKFTNILVIDSIMSILLAIFILKSSFLNLRDVIDLFLVKVPNGISLDEVKERVLSISNVLGVHHVHIWSIDGVNKYATMHVVIKKENSKIKNEIKDKLKDFGISHVTIELENEKDMCDELDCKVTNNKKEHHCHHH